MARLLPIKLSALIFSIAVLVAACADSPTITPVNNATFTLNPSTDTPIPPTPTPFPTPDIELVDPNSFLTHTPSGNSFLPISASQGVQAAINDLRSSQSVERVQLWSLKSIEWRDRGLGCSDEELSDVPLTSQGRIAGYRIVLGNDDGIYIYHSDDNGIVVLCPDAPLFSEEGIPLFFDPATESLSIAAINDLAIRQSIDIDTIEVINIMVITWTDTSLGCPLPDVEYREQEIIGYRLLLTSDDELYHYHADGLQVQFCPAEQELLPPPFNVINPEPSPTPFASVTPS